MFVDGQTLVQYVRLPALTGCMCVVTLAGAAAGVPASATACAATLGAEAAAHAALPADAARGRSAASQSGPRCRPAEPHTDLPEQVRHIPNTHTHVLTHTPTRQMRNGEWKANICCISGE